MNHRQVLDMALRSLPGERARYLGQVADRVQRDARFAEGQHLLFPVLALAAPMLEPLLDPAELTDLLAEFLETHGPEVGRRLYAPGYLQAPAEALREPADLLAAWIGARILDALAAGRLAPPPRRRYSFRSDGGDDGAFPYAGDE
ncbi:MAG TPA: hypothetical protein VED40_06505 [Azospirillaceae bacterium]|nr:hypothetical protein [Azospirillaceae bacterium]